MSSLNRKLVRHLRRERQKLIKIGIRGTDAEARAIDAYFSLLEELGVLTQEAALLIVAVRTTLAGSTRTILVGSTMQGETRRCPLCHQLAVQQTENGEKWGALTHVQTALLPASLGTIGFVTCAGCEPILREKLAMPPAAT